MIRVEKIYEEERPVKEYIITLPRNRALFLYEHLTAVQKTRSSATADEIAGQLGKALGVSPK